MDRVVTRKANSKTQWSAVRGTMSLSCQGLQCVQNTLLCTQNNKYSNKTTINVHYYAQLQYTEVQTTLD